MPMFMEFAQWVWRDPRRAMTWALTFPSLLGFLMLGAGLGYEMIPAKERPVFEAKTAYFLKHVLVYTGVRMTPDVLYVFVGACKVLGGIAIHGFLGRLLDTLANVGFCLLFALVIPTHMQVPAAKDPKALLPLFFLAVALARLVEPFFQGRSKEKRG
eukprot:TRINITY_DN71326_c0_g1_i1.p1 TRINITY_DN71326_c0_g1~~TRINITY_DN71326_c0_g1_i1.p1  ORF type:complete len:157 (+),score=23.35 TRINITY_DN71326_c0_g1_i1:75-545(+)